MNRCDNIEKEALRKAGIKYGRKSETPSRLVYRDPKVFGEKGTKE
jgi:hypothetical protein